MACCREERALTRLLSQFKILRRPPLSRRCALFPRDRSCNQDLSQHSLPSRYRAPTAESLPRKRPHPEWWGPGPRPNRSPLLKPLLLDFLHLDVATKTRAVNRPPTLARAAKETNEQLSTIQLTWSPHHALSYNYTVNYMHHTLYFKN